MSGSRSWLFIAERVELSYGAKGGHGRFKPESEIDWFFFSKEYLPLTFVFCFYFKYLFIGCIRSLLWCRSSSLVAYELSCPIACGTVDPRPEIESASPALENGFLTTGPPGRPTDWFFKKLSHREACSFFGVQYTWM